MLIAKCATLRSKEICTAYTMEYNSKEYTMMMFGMGFGLLLFVGLIVVIVVLLTQSLNNTDKK